jgi:signal transduction histidine kinase
VSTPPVPAGSGIAPEDTPDALAKDVATVQKIGVVPSILELICHKTGMGFAAVARVTDGTWTACAVRDDIGFGLLPGGQLDVHTTLCKEARLARQPVAFDHASTHPLYRDHHTPRTYNIESYLSVPIVLPDGEYFGNLCAIHPKPALVTAPELMATFEAFAALISTELARCRREETFEAALRDERAVSVLREQFIAVLGHDLRNPLSAIFTAGDVLVRGGPAVDSRAVGQRIQASARRMTRLIDDVLDFARGRLGSGIGTRMALTADLDAVLSDVVAETRLAHPGRVIDARIEVPSPGRYDRARLQQLLSNLLGNAMHHGDAALPVAVEAREDGGLLVMAVTNGGRPIPPEHLARIFEPYWRPPSSAPGGGLGLGLHICAQIAAAHDGRMDVSSTPDGHTRFVALIPIRAD